MKGIIVTNSTQNHMAVALCIHLTAASIALFQCNHCCLNIQYKRGKPFEARWVFMATCQIQLPPKSINNAKIASVWRANTVKLISWWSNISQFCWQILDGWLFGFIDWQSPQIHHSLFSAGHKRVGFLYSPLSFTYKDTFTYGGNRNTCT